MKMFRIFLGHSVYTVNIMDWLICSRIPDVWCEWRWIHHAGWVAVTAQHDGRIQHLTRTGLKQFCHHTPRAIKNVAFYFCLYLRQLLTSFTGTLCRQFAIIWLLCIPPHSKCLSTLLC